MDPVVQSLRDIRDLDSVPWWPPAPGWWVVLGLVVLIMLFIRWRVRTRQFRRDEWRRDASHELKALRKGLRNRDPKVVASELSELLRRIAMARCGRRDCAGLMGDEWLDWLHRHDPSGFDWRRRGRLLLKLPYAPSGHGVKWTELRWLINAALRWVAAEEIPPEKAQYPPMGKAIAVRVSGERTGSARV